MNRKLTRTTLATAALAASGVLVLTGCGSSSTSSSAVSSTATGITVQSVSPDAGAATQDGQGAASSEGADSSATSAVTGTASNATRSGGTGDNATGSSQGASSSPSASTGATHAGATPVTMANLPGASVFRLPGSFYDRATIGDSGEGSGQAPLSMCQTHGWGDQHPTAEFTRDVSMSEAQNPQNTGRGGATIASFASHDAAVQAANVMARSLDCTAVTHSGGYVAKSLEVSRSTATLSGGQTAHLLDASYGIDDDEHAGGYTQVGVVATGTHVELISFEGRTQGGASPSTVVNALNAALPALQR